MCYAFPNERRALPNDLQVWPLFFDVQNIVSDAARNLKIDTSLIVLLL